MLVLTLRENEGVQIDGPCRVVFVQVRGSQARIGFEADKEVAILRENAKQPLSRKDEP